VKVCGGDVGFDVFWFGFDRLGGSGIGGVFGSW
jgi:hypothetical protein